MSDIFFTGFGACREVGRSSFLIDCGEKILLDRGLKISQNAVENPLPVKTNLDAVVISHAHLDHSGHLPHLFVDSNILSYMTPPTLDVARMLWFDSLKIAGLEGMVPDFSEDEIARTEKYAFPVIYKRKIDITKNASLEFFDAGHILGSALTKISLKQKTLLYTGDFRVDETKLLKGADLNVGKADYVIIESTYGDRNHPDRKVSEKLFVEEIQKTIDNGGWCVVAAFAVGRSQEILEILTESKIECPIFLDGMGQHAARIALAYPQYLKDPNSLKKALSRVELVKNPAGRKKFFKQPSIVITTAGMLNGGPVLHYIKKLYNDKKSKVFLTGYQVKDTPGRTLLESKTMDIDGQNYAVDMAVEKFDFSAHASQNEMMHSLKKWSPEKIVLVHGDPEVMGVFRKKIETDLGIETVIPNLSEKIKL